MLIWILIGRSNFCPYPDRFGYENGYRRILFGPLSPVHDDYGYVHCNKTILAKMYLRFIESMAPIINFMPFKAQTILKGLSRQSFFF